MMCAPTVKPSELSVGSNAVLLLWSSEFLLLFSVLVLHPPYFDADDIIFDTCPFYNFC